MAILSSGLRAAALDDALWQPHALRLPCWSRCGKPLPKEPDAAYGTYHAIHRAARMRCPHCSADEPKKDGPSKRPWRITWPALERARGLANAALTACAHELLLAAMTRMKDGSDRLSLAAWLTCHDATTGSTAGVGARCWAKTREGSWIEELERCSALPRARVPPPGWVTLDAQQPAEPAPEDDECPRPALALAAHEWAQLERWAADLHERERGGPPARTGSLSSALEMRTRTAALAFAEQLVAGHCVLCFELERCAVAGTRCLRRVGVGAWHMRYAEAKELS